MFKLCMCIVVIFSSTLIGNWFATRLKSRRKSLFILIEAITRMKNHISFSGYDISRVVCESFHGLHSFEIFCSCDSSTEDFHLWWENVVASIPSDSGLNREDKRLLLRFSDSLGVTDIEGQLSNCDFYIEVFSQRLKEADTAEEKNSRLYKILGFSLGSIVTLTLM